MTETEERRGSTGTALVTGASSGIGRELANVFAAEGDDVVLVARRRERLRAVADELESSHGVDATVLRVDLSRPDAAREVFDRVRQTGIDVDTLVNNAGFPLYGRFDETDLDAELDMIRVQVTTLTHLTKLFVRPMVDRGHGRVLNTASIAGEAPNPVMPVYASTKAYVLSFSEALSRQFGSDGITVTALSPGWTDTASVREYVRTHDIDVDQFADPEAVARAGYEGLMDGETIVIPGDHNREYVRRVRSERASQLE